jgi:hypothetical protein
MSHGQRRAALALSALPSADRRWLLARLPADDSRVLDRLLRDFDRSGLSASPELVHAALAEQAQAELHGQAAGPEWRIAQANGAEIQAALAGEPLWVAVMICSLAAWPWRANFLFLADGDTRQAISSFDREAGGAAAGNSAFALAPRARMVLLERLAQRLGPLKAARQQRFEQLLTSPADVRPAGILGRLSSWLL